MSNHLQSRRLQGLCRHAQNASHNSTMKTRLGACVLFRGKIVNIGTNNNVRNRINGLLYQSVHAEVDAIHKFIQSNCKNIRHLQRSCTRDYIIKKINLLVVRYTLNGDPAKSRPCNQCLNYMSRIKGVVINTVYYFNDNGILVSEKFNSMEYQYNSPCLKSINLIVTKDYVKCCQ